MVGSPYHRDAPYHDFDLFTEAPTEWSHSQTLNGTDLFGAGVSQGQNASPQWLSSASWNSETPTLQTADTQIERSQKLTQNINTPSYRIIAQTLRHSQPFRAILGLFQYFDNTLHRLSGDGTTAKDMRPCLTVNEEQKPFKEKMRTCFLEPPKPAMREQDKIFQAVLAVTTRFVDLGLLKNADEASHFTTSLGKVSIKFMSEASTLI